MNNTTDLILSEQHDNNDPKLAQDNPSVQHVELASDEGKQQLEAGMMQKLASLRNLTTNKNDEASQEELIRPLDKSAAILKSTPAELVEKGKEFLRSANLIDRILNDIHSIGIVGEEELSLATYLLGTSRLFDKPLAGIVIGKSSSGKSFVLKHVGELFPDEAVLKVHRMSPRALEHMKNGLLVHRFVVAGERSRKLDDDTAEATRSLREMISDGKLSTAIVASSSDGGHETRHTTKDGPIAYIESTTLDLLQIFPEDRTRFLLLTVDETAAQTKAIVNAMAAAADNPAHSASSEETISLHHTIQRLLQPVKVAVPFAQELARSMPTQLLETRRRFGHLLRLIEAVALLHQLQREWNEQGHIIAAKEDYEVVVNRLGGILQRGAESSVDIGTRQLWSVIQTGSHDTFTISHLLAKAGVSENTVRKRIKKLMESGQVVVRAGQAGPQGAEYAIANNPPPLGGINLPLGSEICTSDTDANLVSASTSEEAEEADETTA